MEIANCGLHPLIHTFPKFTLPQDVEHKKAEPKTPHFHSFNQDIVAQSQEEKWSYEKATSFEALGVKWALGKNQTKRR